MYFYTNHLIDFNPETQNGEIIWKSINVIQWYKNQRLKKMLYDHLKKSLINSTSLTVKDSEKNSYRRMKPHIVIAVYDKPVAVDYWPCLRTEVFRTAILQTL